MLCSPLFFNLLNLYHPSIFCFLIHRKEKEKQKKKLSPRLCVFLPSALTRSVSDTKLQIPVTNMSLPHHSADRKLTDDDEIERALESLSPMLWGLTDDRSCDPLQKAEALPPTTGGGCVARAQRPLSPHAFRSSSTGTASTRTATTVAISPPRYSDAHTGCSTRSDPSSVVVCCPAAIVSAPSTPLSTSSSSSSSTFSAEDKNTPHSQAEKEGTAECAGADAAAAATACSKNQVFAEIPPRYGTSSSGSGGDGTAYTRMAFANLTNSARPLSRISFSMLQRRPVSTCSAAQMIPDKPCVSPAVSFPESRRTSSAPHLCPTPSDARQTPSEPQPADAASANAVLGKAREELERSAVQPSARRIAFSCADSGSDAAAAVRAEVEVKIAALRDEEEEEAPLTEAALSTLSATRVGSYASCAVANRSDVPVAAPKLVDTTFANKSVAPSTPQLTVEEKIGSQQLLRPLAAYSTESSAAAAPAFCTPVAPAGPCAHPQEQQPAPPAATFIEVQNAPTNPSPASSEKQPIPALASTTETQAPPQLLPPALPGGVAGGTISDAAPATTAPPLLPLTRQRLCRIPVRYKSVESVSSPGARTSAPKLLPSQPAITTVTPSLAPSLPPAPSSSSSSQLSPMESELLNVLALVKRQPRAKPNTAPSSPSIAAAVVAAPTVNAETKACVSEVCLPASPPPSPPSTLIVSAETTHLKTGTTLSSATHVALQPATTQVLTVEFQNTRFMRLATTERFY